MDTMNNTAGYDENALNSAWDAEDDGFGAADEAQTPEADQPVGEQQPADQPVAADTNTDPAQQEGTQPADRPELFEIMYRGQKEQLTREQLITMAQKGRDYDTVRQERDQLRQYRQEADPALELIKSYAQRNNMSVPDYLDFCRKQELMRGGMTEQDAVTKLGMEKERRELDAKQQAIQAKEQEQTSAQRQAQEARQKLQDDIARFCRTYPGVDPKTIPQEVWAAVKGGDSLTNAYTMHENKRLAADLAAERQNKANQANTPGSLGVNSGSEMDEIDRIWAEDD